MMVRDVVGRDAAEQPAAGGDRGTLRAVARGRTLPRPPPAGPSAAVDALRRAAHAPPRARQASARHTCTTGPAGGVVRKSL